MKGLFLKELFTVKTSIKQMAFSIVLFLVLGFLLKNPAYCGMMVVILMTNITIMAISYDEAVQWTRFAATLPVRRQDLVTSKYLLLLMLFLVGMGISLADGFLMMCFYTETSLAEVVVSALACGLIALFAAGLNIYFSFRFGVEKARILASVIYILPVAALFLGLYMIKAQGFTLPELTDGMVWTGVAGLVVLDMLLVTLSWRMSCRLMERKEL